MKLPKPPDKKIILFGLFALLIVGGVFLVFKKEKNEPQKSPVKPLAQSAVSKMDEELSKDGDNDGLKDWEEILWKTDPNNADTDGDGTQDGQEIKENRNPAKAGPNDKLPEGTQISQENLLSSPESQLTLTETMGRQFLSDYLLLKQEAQVAGSGMLNEDQKNELLKSFMGGLGETTISEDFANTKGRYSEKNINLAASSDQNSIREYGNGLALILKKYFDPIPDSEMTVLKRALAFQDETELKKLGVFSNAYRNSAKETASSLKVPPNYADFHLAIINQFDIIADKLDILKNTFNDPASSMIALKQCHDHGLAAYMLLVNINAYFKTFNIVFAPGEPGEYFKINYSPKKNNT